MVTASLRRPSWSVLALVAGVLGAIPDAMLIASQDDPRSLVWPLVLVPLALVPAPLAWPAPGVRVAAAVLMAAWCFVTGFSLGPALLPCLACMVVAAVRSEP